MGILKYTLNRAVQGLLLVIATMVFLFLLVHLAPGDPITALVGDYPHTAEYEQEMRVKFGLDKPLHEQLVIYLLSAARLDFGYSFRYQAPVSKVVSERLGATLLLMAGAMLFAALIGIILGLLSSLRAYSLFDNAGTVFALLGYSVPVFWLGQMLMLVFALWLGWLPAQGMTSVRESYMGLDNILDILKHLILPLFVLSTRYIAINSRMTRASMLEVLREDYITTARSKGLSEKTVIIRHAFRNALLPVVTVIGVNFGFLLSGSALVETVFSWPGVGLLTYKSIDARDYPVLLAVFMMVSIMVIIANFISDMVYAFLDPRIRY
jgi:peptide/nickel transport system permease protein